VVAKLFNIVEPDRAYFGHKDAQQLAIIQRMVQDLNFDIEVVPMPIVRDSDGLAKSSRNSYLNPDQRRSSTVLFRALQHAKTLITQGERSSNRILAEMEKMIQATEYTRIDYINIVCTTSFEPQEYINSEVLIAIAVWITNTRLIDSIRIDPANLTS
jgi:pantoate--beta-alanine ligase